MNWLKDIIDKWYFKRAINYYKVGLAEDDIEWIEQHSKRLDRMFETTKDYILKATVHSLTPKDHERKKNWIDCLTALQNLSKTKSSKKNIDFLTMKPRVTEEK